MSEDAATPSPAETLDALTANKDWGARLLSGDASARAEFQNLTRKIAGVDQPAAAAAGGSIDLFAPDAREKLSGVSVITDTFGMSDRQKLDMIDSMRERGASDALIHEAFDGERTYTAELHQLAKEKWRDLSSDPAFCRALLSGDAVAERQWRGYCVIAAGGVEG